MEAANVLLVPGLALWLGFPRHVLEIAAFAVSAVAAGILLIVGAAYWHGIDRLLRLREREPLGRALKLADRAQKASLLITFASGAATALALSSQGWSPAVIAAAVLTALAALEYVNYYHRQIQHFDNWNDLKRLLKSWKLRRSHMARDLATYRRRTG